MAVEFSFCLDTSIRSLNNLTSDTFLDVLKSKNPNEKWSCKSRKSLLRKLSDSLLNPELTVEICSRFKPLILQLLYGAADSVGEDDLLHQQFCVALAKIVFLYPQCTSFAVQYLSSKKPFYDIDRSQYEPAKKKSRKAKSRKKISDLDVCKSCYILLLSDVERFSSVYEWSNVLQFLKTDCVSTKWYAVQALCNATGTSGINKKLMIDKYFSEEQQAILYSEQLILERDLRKCVYTEDCSSIIQGGGAAGGDCVLTNQDLHPSLTSICGILLTKLPSDTTPSATISGTGGTASNTSESGDVIKSMVVVPSTVSALQNLAMAVSCEEPVILSGHIGAGKTSLIEYLAQLTGRYGQLIKVQLGEQIDSRALLGTYCCTETPGQFVWRPGPLTIAVQEGKWLLLEDIDIAPMDVISSLLSLVETGTLPSSNQCAKKSKPGFQLFMTKRLHSFGSSSALSNCSFLEKAVKTVTIQPLSRTELKTVINTLHPNLTQVTDRLLDMYFTLSSGKHVDDRADVTDSEMVRLTSFYGGRKLSTRDLLRWCARISGDFQLMSAQNEISVFQEALDCFCDSLTQPTQRVKLAEAIGTKINVLAEKAQYYCTVYKPTIELSKDLMKVGRASLTRRNIGAAESLNRESRSRFAFTRQSSALLEKIAVCINHEEPVLLVGETGTGKTSVVQYLAEQVGRKLRVINMNQQSDTADLLGGYKPVMISRIISPLREEFEIVFCKTFSRKQNQKFLSHLQQCYSSKRWSDLLDLIEHTVQAALRKTSHLAKWQQLQDTLNTVKLQVKYAESALAFSFVEGALVRALQDGDWVLLDEINLATAETLDCLCGLLDTSQGSVTLTDRGDISPVKRHPDFRLFACMNPATDVGKKDLTAGVRSRFTEFFVDELHSKPDLRVMVDAYLSGLSLQPKQIDGIVNFYLAIKQEAAARLTDGTGKRPTYSLRTLCRALRYAASNPYQATQRSLYEAFCMSFLTQVDRSSHPTVAKLIVHHIIGNAKAKAILSKSLLPPPDVECERFEGYWLKRGHNEPIRDEKYILTDTVKANMRDVGRIVACGRHPVLLQGETSVGKTSMIEYIAKASGNRCVRINNHEHTDVQEYTGSYVADEHGHLVFKEGILIDAMRHGYWIILDELNLAPTDVLEALNRLLDDNRELFIAETQQTIKAHPGFILFATQNPPGLYGGRKMLSRAFRNRFVELHFDEIPNEELEYILHKRCALPMSSSKKIVKVMSELQVRRRDSGLFAGKQGYITLRDVFRWGERYRIASSEISDTFYDWDQLLADQGFMLLAGRVRKIEEEQVIAQVLEKYFKRKVDPLQLFSHNSVYVKELLEQMELEGSGGMFSHIVWTYSLTRLSILVGQSMKYNEPVLMIGDTGCGKTTICQYFAHLYKRELHTVNCHMHTEGSHFLGGLRPVRHSEMETDEEGSGGKLFEWQDGPLVLSMRSGSVLLVDEISLADDSVLERLNSVLEPSRTLVLAEKGGELETIKADSNFRIVATMNPSGDYGKKELSPALRNRFTEIWCPQTKDLNDYKLIIRHNIEGALEMVSSDGVHIEYAEAIVQFVEWFHNQEFGRRFTISVRDILAWVHFINKCQTGVVTSCSRKTTPAEMYIHGACLVFLDALGSANVSDSVAAEDRCIKFLQAQVCADSTVMELANHEIAVEETAFSIGPFSVPLGEEDRVLTNYTLRAPSTSANCLKLLRGLQLHKPILLEGSPGVGKTSLVTALAKATGHNIVRINLSQQTDIADLFGADLPLEGGSGGQFTWRDGLFLQALKSGHWIVLDELNLASQSVLEGLNACFDHRAEVYVPELGKTFHIQHEKVKIFACQNPLKQGGGRQGLPQSFLNRFTQVYVNKMDSRDQEFIASSMYPDIPKPLIEQMVILINQMRDENLPGEYNLRDIFRWCDLIIKYQARGSYSLQEHFSLLFIQPLRSSAINCEKAYSVFERVTGTQARHDIHTERQFYLTDRHLVIGNMLVERQGCQPISGTQACILHKQLCTLESLATCIDMAWMAILDGSECSGKSTIAHALSTLVGKQLKVFPMNNSMDTTDLLGGFEQADVKKSLDKLCEDMMSQLTLAVSALLVSSPSLCSTLMSHLHRLSAESAFHNKLNLADTLTEFAAASNLTSPNVIISWKSTLAKLRTKSKTDGVSSSGSFVWSDSILVEAVTKGHWLLVENAHICSSSVLDRLNSLLEPGGSLTITERGIINGEAITISPHPNFRLILTTNVQRNDLSRAMKNRGIVISTLSASSQQELSADDDKLYSMIGISNDLVTTLRQEHSALWNGRKILDDQVMSERAKLFMSYYQRGFSLEDSLHASRRLYLYYSDDVCHDDLIIDTPVGDSGTCDSHIWSVDSMCRIPSLAMLDQLTTHIRMAASTASGTASVSSVPTILLEQTSLHQLPLLDHLPTLDNLLTERQHLQLTDTVCSAQPLLTIIKQFYTETGSTHLGDLPIDLRWLQDVWNKLPSDTRQPLSCLLNVWNTTLINSHLLYDLKNMAANSWFKLSERVHQGTLDRKHLPHKVTMFYRQISEGITELVATICTSTGDCKAFNEQKLTQMLISFELIRRFLISNNIVSATLCWSWLQPVIRELLIEYSDQKLCITINQVDALLRENNSESYLFNLIWKSFPHLPPINCQMQSAPPISSQQSVADKSQLGTLLQKALDSLSVYTKADTLERQKLISSLPYVDLSDVVSTIVRSVNALHTDEQGQQLAECMMELSTLQSHSDSPGNPLTRPYLSSLWPIREFWLLRAVLHFLSTELGSDRESELLTRLSSYCGSPGPLQLSVQLQLLSQHPTSKPMLLNVISQWFSLMIKCSAFRQGEPFIPPFDLDNPAQVKPSFDSTSMFLIISRLLSDTLSSNNQSELGTDGHSPHSPHSINPSVCVGQFKVKLNQLNALTSELWDHAAFLDCANVSSEEEAFQNSYQGLILHPDCLPEELRLLPQISPAVNKIGELVTLSAGKALSEVKMAERWVWLGLVQSLSTAPRGVLDPVVKAITELNFVNDELDRITAELSLRSGVSQAQCGQELSSHAHPYYLYLQSRLQSLKAKQAELMEGSVHRPVNEQFLALASEAKGLLSNTLNYDNLLNIVTGLQSAGNHKYVARERVTSATLESYIVNVESTYPLYVDCYQPHINAVKLVCYGLKRLSYLTRGDNSTPLSLANNFCTPAQLFNTLPSATEGLQLVQTACELTVLDSNRISHICGQYLRLHTSSLNNLAFNSMRVDDVLLLKISSLLEQYVSMWQTDNARRSEKEMEATSLYSFKQHGEEPETDEQLIEKLTRQSFPSYHQEFSDLVHADTLGDSTEDEDVVAAGDADNPSLSISDQDMVCVSELHCNVMLSLSRTDWYRGQGHQSMYTERKKAHTLLINILHGIISSTKDDCTIESSLSAQLVHLQLISAGLMRGQCLAKDISESDSKIGLYNYDIYRDENVAEAVRCMEPLMIVRARLDELLADWPDHPLLIQIVSILERVKSFPVTDPLMKFTAGLELVLEKLQEWETNAAKYVSVQTAMNSVSQLVIEWRKLELDGWKQSLNNVAYKIRHNSTKYWFHLCSVLLPLLADKAECEIPSVQQLVASLVSFIESSTLGDFSYRLHLLEAFTVHLGVVNSPQHAKMLNSMYSIWQFYAQFEGRVTEHIAKKRAAIEKELKNFVKISRWNDMNFWSVRASVDKSHKTLAKHMKSYHDILISSARNLFTEDVSQLPSLSEAANVYDIEAVAATAVSISSASSSALSQVIGSSESLQCLPKLPHLTKRFHSACDIIHTRLRTFACQSEALDTFSEEIIESVTSLQSLHIISGDDKEKQKKQAKNIDMRKRKSLAMLFQKLHMIGLSYRKGSLKLQNSEGRSDILCSRVSAPLNLQISLAEATSRASKHWVELWTSSNKYMLRCITRRTVFLEASTKPSKELGVDIILRLKGFSEHMIDLLRKHECLLNSYTIQWLRLHKQVLALHMVSSDTGEQVPLSCGVQSTASSLSSAIPGVMEHLEELKMLLLSVPAAMESAATESAAISSPSAQAMLSPVSNMTIYSEKWQLMMSHVDSALAALRKSCEELSTLATRPVCLYSSSDHSLVVENITLLCSSADQIDEVFSLFRAENGQVVLVSVHSSVLATFRQLLEECKSTLLQPTPMSGNDSLSSESFTTFADDTVRELLLACQNSIATLDKVPQLEGDIDSLISGQLTESLKLFDGSIGKMSLDKILKKVSQLTSDVGRETDVTTRQLKCAVLSSCGPLLQLFTSVSQQILIQSWTVLRNSLKLLSILYNIFTHLASKGFCLPEELSDEMEGEGQGDFNTSEGAGLADGEGAKDISDQIENEDDLDDAKRPEDREKEKDTPEAPPPQDDNAIEMSEDFDGAMEDAPATEVDEEDENASSGDEDEMDDKMGDIGDSELKEKLDDKLWGDDDANDADDDKENKEKEEEVGKGSEETKQEMVAKDENPEESVPDKEDKQQKQEEEKDLNELEKDSAAEEYNQDEQPDPYIDGDKDKEAEADDNDFDLPDNLDLDDMEDNAGEEEVGEEQPMEVDEEGADGDEQGEEKEGETEETEEINTDDAEEGKGDEKESPTIAEMEPESTPDTEPEKEQQNVEAYGATTQITEDQIIEQLAQDRGGETESKEEQGAGQSESSTKKEAGFGDSYQTGSADDTQKEEKQSQLDTEQRSADDKRVLGDTESQCSMQLDTIQSASDKQAPAKQHQSQPPSSTLYEHITTDQQETADAQAMDAANEDELEEQQKADEKETDQTDGQLPEEITKKEKVEEEQRVQLKAKELSERLSKSKLDKESAADEGQEEMEGDEAPDEGEEETVEEVKETIVNRESTIHTDLELLQFSQQEVAGLKEDLERKMSEWSIKSDYEISESEARDTWEKYDAVTRSLSHELCEQLRLILEPTQAAKLRGDYRTGKRLNMRKVIAYIASQFRKDAIWLRRTQPSKREYQIAIAVDDSSSMVDNHSKQLAFEALACISNALTYLQAGDMSIVSFGEDVKMVHDFSSRFSWEDGGDVLRNFSFKQKKTRIAHMLNCMSGKFQTLRRSGGGGRKELAQLLMVVSDGRGLFLEGVDAVNQAVRRAINSGIFLVFVIIDNPNSKDSILDIKIPVFSGTGPPQIKSYMDSFPFPFYVILRDINSLPNTLGDALRQWFELVTSQT